MIFSIVDPETVFLALLFVSLMAGILLSLCRFFSMLGQYTCVLLCSLGVGVIASMFDFDFSKLQSTMDSVKTLLFLLFIFAAGYTNGPGIYDLFRKLKANSSSTDSNNSDQYSARKFVRVSVVVFLVALLTVFCAKHFLKDDSIVSAITAGSLTQTTILGLTTKATPGDYSNVLNREIVFTLTYIISTIITMVFCSSLLPSWSQMFGGKFHGKKNKEILFESAKELNILEDGKAISFKYSPIPDRVGRAFTVKENMDYDSLKKQLAEHYLTLQEVLDPNGNVKDISQGISPNDIVITQGERESMNFASEIIGSEMLKIPREWQRHFTFASKSLFLTRSESRQKIRNVCNEHNMCIEQIIDPDGNDVERFGDDGDVMLSKGTKIKLFGIERDMKKVAEELKSCFVIPKDKNTGIALMSACILVAIALALIPGLNLIGNGLLTFLFGIAIGCWHESNPKKYSGFPPQATQLFQTFGLAGFLAITGLGAANKIMCINFLDSGLWIVLIWALVIMLLPLISGMFAALFWFKNNAAISATTVAGARSSNMAYEDVYEKCAGNGKSQLETSFSISYAIANILLTLIGLVF